MSSLTTLFGVSVIGSTLAYILTHRRFRRKQISVTVIGDVFCDIIVSGAEALPEWGADSVTKIPLHMRSGGSALNTAVWLSNLFRVENMSVGVRIPKTWAEDRTDAFTECVRRTVAKNSDTGGSLVVVNKSRPSMEKMQDEETSWLTGTCLAISGPNDRCFVSYRGGNGEYTFSDFNFEAMVPSLTRYVHIAGYYNCPGLWGDNCVEFIKRCRTEANVQSISLNPQYGKGWGGNIQAVLPLVDYFICNEEEAVGIAAVSAEGTAVDIVAATMKLANEFLAPNKCVVVTLGAEGALFMRNGIETEPFRVVCKEALESWHVTDAIGVGDAFCGGFINYVVKKDLRPDSPEIADAVRFGCACGTAALTVLGGSEFPGLSTINDCLVD